MIQSPTHFGGLSPAAAVGPSTAGGQVLRAPDLSLPALRLGTAGGSAEGTGRHDGRAATGGLARAASGDEAPERPTADRAAVFRDAGGAGYEDGLQQGLAEGRAHAERELQQASAALQQAMNQRVQQALEDGERSLQQRVRTLEAEAQGAVEARLRQLDGVIGALNAQARSLQAEVEDDTLAICHAAVCRILGERALQPGVLVAHLSDVVRNMPGEGPWTVHLHPDDFVVMSALAGQSTEHVPALANLAQVQWRASADVKLGGCIVRGENGGLDARWETQLAELREVLRRERRERHEFVQGAQGVQHATTAQ